ncbi:MAG: hypothetical protein QM500_02290 [Methylococcales bacterium]
MSMPKTSGFNKTVLSISVATALGLGVVSSVQADIYEFEYKNDIVSSPTVTDEALFTMLDPAGAVLQNTSYPYYGDPTWGYGLRTQLGGKLSFDTSNKVASATIGAFEFFNGGAASASGITMKQDTGSSLWMANMTFAWGTAVISTQAVLDATGLFAELPPTSAIPAIGTIIGAGTCTTSTVCALPASDGVKKGKYPMGVAPVAMSSFNTIGQTGAGTTLGQLSLGTDDAIGGSPMDNGPFTDFNANFDFRNLVVTGYNDTEAPVLTLGDETLVLTTGAPAFDVYNPGTAVTCTDNYDGVETVDAQTNDEIDFDTPVGLVDTSTQEIYTVTYNCNDSAVKHAPVIDPADPSATTTPADLPSNTKVLTVIVSDPYRPVIVPLGPLTVQHEACTRYDDAGVSAEDPEEGALTVDTVEVPVGFNASTPSTEIQATLTFTATDIGDSNVPVGSLTSLAVVRTINVVDSLGPVITLPSAIVLESSQAAGYAEPTATDVLDCYNITESLPLTTANKVDFSVPDGKDSVVSELRYIATDDSPSANQTVAPLAAIVYRSEPVITLLGNTSEVIDVDGTYVEAGMDVRDVQDGTLSAIKALGTATATGIEIVPAITNVTGSGNIEHTIVMKDAAGNVVTSVNTSVEGASYTVTYSVMDSVGNTVTAIRTINIGVYAQDSNFTMLDPLGLLVDGSIDVVSTWDQATTTDIASTDFNMTIVSARPTPFKGFPWVAHHVRTFSAGDYEFDSTCTLEQLETGVTACNNALGKGQTERFMKMKVGPSQVGAHILFNWGAKDGTTTCGVASCDIDVAVVWNLNAKWEDPQPTSSTNKLYIGLPGEVGPDPEATWGLVSTDPDGDLINGIKMVDGPFIGFNANFNFNPDGTSVAKAIVMTAPDTKLSSGSVGWVSLLAGLFTLLSCGVFRKKNA